MQLMLLVVKTTNVPSQTPTDSGGIFAAYVGLRFAATRRAFDVGKNPSFPFFASDWLGSNNRAMMTLEQQGAYINLLCRQWADPTCSLPDDDQALAYLSELGEGWFTNGSALLRLCFPKHPHLEGRIANEKLLECRLFRDQWVEKSKKGGVKSGASRRLRKSNQTRTKREPNANQTRSPITYPIKDTSYPYSYPLPPTLDTSDFRSAWDTYLDHRREKKSKLTPTAAKMVLSKLEGMGLARAIAAIKHSVSQGWTGIFEADSGGRSKTAIGPGQRHPSDLSDEEGTF
jgi:uncharacterized protein YdaU (DUF1376 family)